MLPLEIFFVVALGAIIGSFLNALLFRFNTGRSVAKGRSRCMHCGHELGALDLVPIFSFLFLQGRCRYCHAKISWQYPLIEFTAAVLALLIYFMYGSNLLASGYWLLVWMTLLFIVVYDIRHGIIPWSASILLAALAFASLFISVTDISVGLPTVSALMAGPLLALPLFLFSLVSKGTWMGWGDSGLELSLGWLLGLTQGLTALMLAFWSGALVGIVLMAVSKRYTIKSEIPFAPFLVLGVLLAQFFHVDFFSSIYLLWQ
jgi:leader peptidase (prepilin peptidase)/N-methyltransferase